MAAWDIDNALSIKGQNMISKNGKTSITDQYGREIFIDTLHNSGYSDPFDPRRAIGGIIIWGMAPPGRRPIQNNGVFKKTTHHRRTRSSRLTTIFPGYMYMTYSDDELMSQYHSDHGQVHGSVYKSLFGEEPNTADGQGMVISGFAYKDGELKFTSRLFNTGSNRSPRDGDFSDGDKDLSEKEQEILIAIYRFLKPGQDMPMTEINRLATQYHKDSSAPWSCLLQ